MSVPQVYEALQAVQRDLLAEGVGKNNVNKEQRYKYRSIEDVINAIAPLLPKHGLLITPTTKDVQSTTYTSKSGTPMHRTVVHMVYECISVKDGSKHCISVAGEGSDVSDKATNKALSFAYKYAMSQALCIPFKGLGDMDGDNGEGYRSDEHRALPKQEAEAPKEQAPAPTKSKQEVAKEEVAKVTSWIKSHILTIGMDHTKIEPGKYSDQWRDVVDIVKPKIDGLKASPKAITLENAKAVCWQVVRWQWYLCNLKAWAGNEESLAELDAICDDDAILSQAQIDQMRGMIQKAYTTYHS